MTLESFRCPRCGAVSRHPMDVNEGYCGACHDWTADRRFVNRYYDREGEPIPMREWAERFDDLAYRHVAVAAVDDDVEVSTVWLGLDHRFMGSGPPLIFETLIFGGPLDGQMWRWSSEEAALAGHDQAVAAAREANTFAG